MSTSAQHLDQEQLLRYADGELPSREANQARSHLEACWQCRVEFEELQETIAECVRYRKDIQHFLPPTPSPWADIYRRFDEIDRSLDRPNLFQRVRRQVRWAAMPKWVPVSVALIVATVLIYRLRETPSVQASELLRKAIVAADETPARPRMIQIRTKHAQIRRLAGSTHSQALQASASEPGSIEALFASAHYNWRDPLSAKSYRDWRDQLPQKRDEVIHKNDEYLIKTASDSSPLTEATLRLSVPDLRPVEEHLQFGDNEWVEVTEVAPDVAAAPPASKAAGEETLHAAPPAAAPDAPVASLNAPSPLPAGTAGDEIKVLLTLHRMNADLGDPIDVSRSGSQVLVSGVGIPPQRQQEIRNALASNANVVVRFSEPVASTAQSLPPRPESAASADMSQLQARVAEKLGGRVNFEELSSQVLDLTDQMMSRTYALHRLAEKFPAATDATLSPSDRQALAGLRQEHQAVLIHISADLDHILRPVFVSLNVNPRGSLPEAGLSLTWQPATEEIFQSARQVEKLTALMFGAVPNDSASQQIPNQLAASLSLLRTRLAAYARIGTEETDRPTRPRVTLEPDR
jgi:hypothetical protein